MKAGKIKSLFMFIIGCFYAVCAYSATSLFSDYGQIQNVQNYSTNPFWSPNAPYNQKMPQPVYVQGNAVTTDECIRVIQSAVAFQCAARDNCRNTQLTDIRPAIIVQLSNLPGKAYGTACAGYLDSVFESYVAQYGNNAPTRQVAFPDSTIPNPSINNNSNTIQIKNPYEIKTPQWQQEINERSRELQELQSENGAGNYGLSATAFPTTYNDLSFTDRMTNEAAGYAPYKDKSAYKTIEVKTGDEWCKEHQGSKECKEYEEKQRLAQKKSEQPKSTNTSKQQTNKELRAEVDEIVALLNPSNTEEKELFTALANSYLTAKRQNATLKLDNDFISGFFAEASHRPERYKDALANLSTKPNVSINNIDIDWLALSQSLSGIMDEQQRIYGAMVCENNRSLQMALDIGSWATIILPIGGPGLKAGYGAAKAVTGLSKASKFATAAAKTAGGKIASKKGLALIGTGIAGLNADKIISGDQASEVASTFYSLFNSDADTSIINCKDLDKNEGCYTVCGQIGPQDQDDLNKKVFQKILKKSYCVDPDTYILQDIDTREPLQMDAQQKEDILTAIQADTFHDNGNCDRNEDDIDIYVGYYVSNPQSGGTDLSVTDVSRLDD